MFAFQTRLVFQTSQSSHRQEVQKTRLLIFMQACLRACIFQQTVNTKQQNKNPLYCYPAASLISGIWEAQTRYVITALSQLNWAWASSVCKPNIFYSQLAVLYHILNLSVKLYQLYLNFLQIRKRNQTENIVFNHTEILNCGEGCLVEFVIFKLIFMNSCYMSSSGKK